jgi:alkaline phosphatase
MKKSALFAFLSILAFFTLTPTLPASEPAADGTAAKYVFLFIGDGMSAVQIYAAEGYSRALRGKDANNGPDLADRALRLNMDTLPVRGMQTTYAYDHLITDSAAAGTALACGSKTSSGVIGMDHTKTRNFLSIAELARDRGRRVGIVSSVSLDHATPASFYANVASRAGYDEIAVQAARSHFNFFGGGGWLKSVSANYRSLYPDAATENVDEIFAREGYATLRSDEAIRALVSAPRDRVVCTAPVLAPSAAMPYAIDRPEGQVSLADVTEAAIACLAKDGAGFFLMVEGGKVDWACHANDAIGALGDVLDLDVAIGKALDFASRHPGETLIVVTGDHETGGLTIGFAGRGYETSLDNLLRQKTSFEAFAAKVKAYRAAMKFAEPYDAASHGIDASMKELIRGNFGIDCDTIAPYRKALLENAYDRSMGGAARPGDDVPTGYEKGFGAKQDVAELDYLYYGDYDALTMEICHQLSRETGLGWTTYAHTAVPVPVMATGVGQELFSGYYENADIAKKLAAAMGLGVELPVVEK